MKLILQHMKNMSCIKNKVTFKPVFDTRGSIVVALIQLVKKFGGTLSLVILWELKMLEKQFSFLRNNM